MLRAGGKQRQAGRPSPLLAMQAPSEPQRESQASSGNSRVCTVGSEMPPASPPPPTPPCIPLPPLARPRLSRGPGSSRSPLSLVAWNHEPRPGGGRLAMCTVVDPRNVTSSDVQLAASGWLSSAPTICASAPPGSRAQVTRYFGRATYALRNWRRWRRANICLQHAHVSGPSQLAARSLVSQSWTSAVGRRASPSMEQAGRASWRQSSPVRVSGQSHVPRTRLHVPCSEQPGGQGRVAAMCSVASLISVASLERSSPPLR